MTYWNKEGIERYLERFVAWLAERGAETLKPTNEWELVRFNAGKEKGIIYTNAKGRIRFTGVALAAWESFRSSGGWRAAEATKRKAHATPRIATIRARDGDLCFFCLEVVKPEHESEDHIVAKTFGGPNHIANLVLAHRTCNSRAGNLSAAEKIAAHVAAHLHKSKSSRKA